MEKGLLENTGESLDHWLAVVHSADLDKPKEIIRFLKDKHEFTYGFANFMALKALKSDAVSVAKTEELVELQYQKKQDL